MATTKETSPKTTSEAVRLRLVVSSDADDEGPRIFEMPLPVQPGEQIGGAVTQAAAAFGRALLDALDEERQRPRAA
jgi:hypothetical protein